MVEYHQTDIPNDILGASLISLEITTSGDDPTKDELCTLQIGRYPSPICKLINIIKLDSKIHKNLAHLLTTSSIRKITFDPIKFNLWFSTQYELMPNRMLGLTLLGNLLGYKDTSMNSLVKKYFGVTRQIIPDSSIKWLNNFESWDKTQKISALDSVKFHLTIFKELEKELIQNELKQKFTEYSSYINLLVKLKENGLCKKEILDNLQENDIELDIDLFEERGQK